MIKIRRAKPKDFYSVLRMLQQFSPDLELEEVSLSEVFH